MPRRVVDLWPPPLSLGTGGASLLFYYYYYYFWFSLPVLFFLLLLSFTVFTDGIFLSTLFFFALPIRDIPFEKRQGVCLSSRHIPSPRSLLRQRRKSSFWTCFLARGSVMHLDPELEIEKPARPPSDVCVCVCRQMQEGSEAERGQARWMGPRIGTTHLIPSLVHIAFSRWPRALPLECHGQENYNR
ncbi:hypothetical protein B0I35DRAFT_122775 [Stachybotrys elegans]|uniref:Uncharacterized protein n=1 Tax=Stachybotrys elegans TaxID=80388 RepID=A0A8K0SXQ9_9HYPO|nr:hypothetical protein B0I35DRAFT_122775 [Stachybotrys elegans]